MHALGDAHLLLGLSREADDGVGRDGGVGQPLADGGDDLQEALGGVAAAEGGVDPAGTSG